LDTDLKGWKESLEDKDEGTSCFERRMRLVNLVLSRLDQQAFRWTPLLKALINACGSPPRLYYILRYLEKNGFVCRTMIEGKSHWAITDKGKELLKVPSADQNDFSKTYALG